MVSEEGGFRMSPEVSDSNDDRLEGLLSSTSTKSAPPAIMLTGKIDDSTCLHVREGQQAEQRQPPSLEAAGQSEAETTKSAAEPASPVSALHSRSATSTPSAVSRAAVPPSGPGAEALGVGAHEQGHPGEVQKWSQAAVCDGNLEGSDWHSDRGASIVMDTSTRTIWQQGARPIGTTTATSVLSVSSYGLAASQISGDALGGGQRTSSHLQGLQIHADSSGWGAASMPAYQNSIGGDDASSIPFSAEANVWHDARGTVGEGRWQQQRIGGLGPQRPHMAPTGGYAASGALSSELTTSAQPHLVVLPTAEEAALGWGRPRRRPQPRRRHLGRAELLLGDVAGVSDQPPHSASPSWR